LSSALDTAIKAAELTARILAVFAALQALRASGYPSPNCDRPGR
jgi:hypothetical protein